VQRISVEQWSLLAFPAPISATILVHGLGTFHN
jgi:hypothetical protein